MYAKSLLIPIAAFALSATGVSAFNPDVLQSAGLTDDQISAFEDARELQQEGKLTKARDVLKDASIDVHTMELMRDAVQAKRASMRDAIEVAVEANDFTAFKKAVSDSPLSDIVTSKEDFALFSQALTLHKQGEDEQVEALIQELGFEPIHKQHAFKNSVLVSI